MRCFLSRPIASLPICSGLKPFVLSVSFNSLFLISHSVMSSWVLFCLSSSCSKTCENGPCPTSCSKPAILTASASSVLISCEMFGFSVTLPARYMTPMECSNRVWFAPG